MKGQMERCVSGMGIKKLKDMGMIQGAGSSRKEYWRAKRDK